MGTTRVNALELPLIIAQLKQAKELLKWGYLKTVIVDNILYFLWQDRWEAILYEAMMEAGRQSSDESLDEDDEEAPKSQA